MSGDRRALLRAAAATLPGETPRLDAELDVLYAKSTLRERPDHKGIASLYKEICEERYGLRL